MWLFILVAVLAVMAIGIVYLTNRIYKTELVRKLSKEKKVLRILIALCVVILLAAVCTILFDTINMVIILIHMLCIWLVVDVIHSIIAKKRKKTKNYNFIVLLGSLITIVYLGIGWYEAHNVVVTNYTLESEKVKDSLKVVQITDSHVGATFDGKGFAKHVKKIQKEKPDVVVITGDFVDDNTSKEDMITSCEALGTLETKYGVYYVFGNHDKGYSNTVRGYDENELMKYLKANNVKIMQDKTALIGEDYVLVGRQDKSEDMGTQKRATMETLVQNVDMNKYSIVLDHQPNDYDAEEKSGVDLVLSGHTHGGQFFPITYVGEWTGVNDMTYGIRQKGDTTFIVSSGISDWAIKFKTACKSEYVVINVNPQK